MSTHCFISIELDENFVECIYCNFDGYIFGGVGETLYEFYNTKEKVVELLSMGSAQSIDNSIEESKFYVRDLKESMNHNKAETKVLKRLLEKGIVYTFTRNNEWLVNNESLDEIIKIGK